MDSGVTFPYKERRIMPFVLQGRKDYLGYITRTEPTETIMNWIFEAYSNVYTTAMMQDREPVVHVASAKAVAHKPHMLARFFGRS
jgi:hypothetical protein